jgi:hypothetical protein
LGVDMCGHCCGMGSEESHSVGQAIAIGAGIVRLPYYLPIYEELNLNFQKDMSRASQLQLRLWHLHIRATSWIHGKRQLLLKFGYWCLRITVDRPQCLLSSFSSGHCSSHLDSVIGQKWRLSSTLRWHLWMPFSPLIHVCHDSFSDPTAGLTLF